MERLKRLKQITLEDGIFFALVVFARLGVERIERARLRGLVHALPVILDRDGDGRAVLDERERNVLRPGLD